MSGAPPQQKKTNNQKHDHNKETTKYARKGVVLEVDAAAAVHDRRLALALVRARRHRRGHVAARVGVDDDAVLAQLLLDEDDLLRALFAFFFVFVLFLGGVQSRSACL